MQFKIYFLTAILLALFSTTSIGQSAHGTINGVIHDQSNLGLPGATVSLLGAEKKVITDQNGHFRFSNLKAGAYTLVISSIGYVTRRETVQVLSSQVVDIDISLLQSTFTIDEVRINHTTEAQGVRNRPFSVDVIEMKNIRERDVDLNRMLGGRAGIRVQETGGLGSEFNYSIDGLSGKAVKFFLDGVPMETFGTSYSINNFPVNLIDRVEIYKGVIPVELGGDVLGGAINITTRKDINNYLDISQSAASFSTYRTALSAKWRQKSSGFTLRTNSLYNYSDNDYEVWGPTVEVADEFGRPLPGTPRFRRFNDQFKSLSIHAEVGFTQVKWADQLLIGFVASDLDKGLQTGRTMAFVFGKASYKENFLMPSLKFSKRDFLFDGLDINVHASMNRLRGTTTDTSKNRYNWNGDIIATNANGELGGIRSQPSIYTLKDEALLTRVGLSYRLAANHVLGLNYMLSSTTRKGSDAISLAEWTIPFRQPQDFSKHVTGLSYEMKLLDEKWTNTFFVKNFVYAAKASVYDYRGADSKELFIQNTRDNTWGFGYASKVKLSNKLSIRYSAENTTRLPEAEELFGNGNMILNAPALQLEKSLNLNLSAQKIFVDNDYFLTGSLNTFYRNTKDLIWLGEGDLFGTARYENIDRIQSLGVDAEVSFSNKKWLDITGNVTYQDIRNKLKYTSSGAANLVYNDRLRNTPYLMANGEAKASLPGFKQADKASVYINTHYVQRYFLGWPSLGERSFKKNIPAQFVQDAGLGYSFKNNAYGINLTVRNIFDQQVYDNYLLQKPGRFISAKLRYFIN